ncbi:hypothetical protein WJX79_000122 [Trebouxia sp. C0005]
MTQQPATTLPGRLHHWHTRNHTKRLRALGILQPGLPQCLAQCQILKASTPSSTDQVSSCSCCESRILKQSRTCYLCEGATPAAKGKQLQQTRQMRNRGKFASSGSSVDSF